MDNESIKTSILKEEILEERRKELYNLNNLSSKVCRLHTTLLFYQSKKQSAKGTACKMTRQSLVKGVGSIINGFFDLGRQLEIDVLDLNFISNCIQTEPDRVHVVLKTFAQHDKATLDKVVQALIKMKWLHIVKSLEEPLTNLEKAFANTKDSGYYGDSGQMHAIALDNVDYSDLPTALLLKENIPKAPPTIESHKNNDRRYPAEPPMSSLKAYTDLQKKGNPILFLSFTKDGTQTARNIQQYVQEWTEVPGMTIITLNDNNREEVLQNPGNYIQNCFKMADLIVPIITPEYLAEISQHRSHTFDTNANLDHKYCNLIYQTFVNDYVQNGCYNFKVRSVIPSYISLNYIKDIGLFPILNPWTHEVNFNEYFKAFLNLA